MSDRQPTRFGLYVLRKMAAHNPPLTQSDLARQVPVSQSTISRWIFKEGLPEYGKLEALAPVLGVTVDEMLAQAGYGRQAADASEATAMHPLALELDQMLGEASRVPEAEREHLRIIIDRVIDPYRKPRRRRA
ncbi:helix-turn-helix domain-containing protein [Micromonospora peucetia]|uniref:Helix-turn-helix domain-containing protein n=1 Tax=Micromonospora peucetia TaxID=47871 RepID=A0ABZ1EJV3_9ACTN|nr:helix-turn-helix domain-containing protein [Micromonospora peucetia]WSA34511.1 helix-turn-helix domain-containing protein [Micromonospora peucetia]